ncbi:MAG: hypothetical protein PG981_001387 [Wolbachia endosymbiont of Ctenocephalides orientis wCori]|nr:MAG: hypothetical protein PG981_001387 [Wolbachia endosymbiont of Ctenocephalides orientis wCori]
MSYNEEGLIRVKRADDSNRKNLEEEVDSVTTATPIEESIQPVETRSIILLEMPWILPGSSCKPFKDFHDKKDDHDDSNGGHGGNDPKPGPSGEARSIESSEARSIVDIPEAGSGFVKAVDDLTGLIADIKTLIAKTAEAERVYRVSNGDCRQSKEISFKGFGNGQRGLVNIATKIMKVIIYCQLREMKKWKSFLRE